MKKSILLHSPTETQEFAAKIGSLLRGGECIELSSDLGGGKTTFTRGLLAGMGSDAAVSSPTFTISKQYAADDLTVFHFDFYRLSEPGVVAEELREVLQDPKSVVVIEWAETVAGVLPAHKILVEIARTAEDESHRYMTVHIPDYFPYLIEGLKI